MFHSYLHIFALLALVNIAASVAGVATVPIHATQLRPRTDTSNTTLNAIDFLLILNATLIKYNSSALAPLKGVDLQAEVNRLEALDTPPDVISTASNHRRPPLHDIAKRADRYPPGIELLHGLDAMGRFVLGRSSAGRFMPSIPTVFDTASGLTTFPGFRCGPLQGCLGNVKYPETGYDTGVNNNRGYVHQMGVEARNFLDEVTVAGITATGVTVASLRNAGQIGSPIHGQTAIVGLGIWRQTGETTFFEALVRDTAIAPEFSFFFGREQDGTLFSSQLMLGGRDARHFSGPAVLIPVVLVADWAIPLSNVLFGQGEAVYAIDAINTFAIVDTGASVLGVPADVARHIMSSVPGSVELVQILQDGDHAASYLAPCESSISISFRFLDRNFAVDPRDMLGAQIDMGFFVNQDLPVPGWALQSGPMCLVNLLGISAAQRARYVIGLPFLRSWYSVFSQQGVTLIKSKPL